MPVSQRYADDSVIGSGGFGQVTVCIDRTTGAKYAKKTLSPGATPDGIDRFIREARLLSRLDHPNVVKVIDSHVGRSPYFFIMPLYRSSLEKVLAMLARRPERVTSVFNCIIAGVEYAHSKGVIHRDLKPQNVLLNSENDVVVSDFGLGRRLDSESTRHTMSGDGMGSIHFTAPEQWTDMKKVDERADVFSLGVLLYALYTGPVEFLDPNHAKLPSQIRRVVRKATQPERDKRYSSVAKLREDWTFASGQRESASVADQMKELVELISRAVRPNETGLVDRLHDLMSVNQDDSGLIFDVMMKLPAGAVERMEARWLDSFQSYVRQFSGHIANPHAHHGFSFMDDIAKQCKTIYIASTDIEVRADLLSCLFVLGYDNNRWFVMDLCDELLQSRKLRGEGALIVERIQGKDSRWFDRAQKRLSPARLDYHLRKLFFPNDEFEDF